ncbi:MAG: hypothetical protein QXW32_04570 [Nitrososphaerales archaeon]
MSKSGVEEGREQEEVRRKVVECINLLNRQAAKLNLSLSKLKAFEDECFRKTIWHLKVGDKASASIYASEVAYLRRLNSALKEIKELVAYATLKLNSLLDTQHLTTSLTTLIETLRQIPHGLDAEDLGHLTKLLCDTATSQKRIERAMHKTDLQTEGVLKEAESKIQGEYSEPLAG